VAHRARYTDQQCNGGASQVADEGKRLRPIHDGDEGLAVAERPLLNRESYRGRNSGCLLPARTDPVVPNSTQGSYPRY